MRPLRRPPRLNLHSKAPAEVCFVYPEKGTDTISSDNKIVKGIWVGDHLSPRELLCIRSYLTNGHEFHLYTYDDHENLPEGTVVKDANEFLPESEIETFRFRANFCDFFRFVMLAKLGGWYVDMDGVCLKPLNFPSKYVFGTCGCDTTGKPVGMFCSEGCYIGDAFMKVPVNSAIMNYCRDHIENTSEKERKAVDAVSYDVLGPRLIQKAVPKFGLEKYVQPPVFFDPVPCYRAMDILNPGISWDLRHSYVVHLNGAQWNEKYHGGRLNRDEKYPDMCLYEQLKKRYA